MTKRKCDAVVCFPTSVDDPTPVRVWISAAGAEHVDTRRPPDFIEGDGILIVDREAGTVFIPEPH
jgi:hypothetical protein